MKDFLQIKNFSFLSSLRFWLLIFIVLQTSMFFLFSFPVLNSFQQKWSAIFFISMLLSAIIIKKSWLIYIVILTLIFLNPSYTYMLGSMQYRFKILVSLLLIILIIIQRRDIKLLIITFFVLNVGLFIYNESRIIQIDNDFRNRSYIVSEKNRLLLHADSSIKAGKNIYVIILDGYPSFDILKDSFQYHSRLKDYLVANQFEIQKPFTIYFFTPLSLLHVFGSRKFKDEGKNPPEYLLTNRTFYSDAIYKSPLGKLLDSYGYRFYFNSLLFDNLKTNGNGFNPLSFWPHYSINDINYLIYRYLILRRPKKGEGEIIKYHKKLDSLIEVVQNNSSKKMAVFHYITFHNIMESLTQNAAYADSVGIMATSKILEREPGATIIVMSDHGEKWHLKNTKYFHYGIYSIRKGF